MAAILFTACSKSASSDTVMPKAMPATEQIALNENGGAQLDGAAMGQDSNAGGISSEAAGKEVNSSGNSADVGRKLIKNVELSIETKEYDKLSTALEKKIAEVGGYVQSSTMNGNSYRRTDTRRCNMVVRIPKDKLDSFITTVSGLGNVIRKAEQVEDVTMQYVDVESHKKSLKIEQERLFLLLEKASDLAVVIALEKRLSEVRYQIEAYESQIRTFDNLVEYSTVTIDYYEVEKITPTEGKDTFWDRISKGFKDSIESIGMGFQNFAVFIVSNILYIILLAAVVIIVFLVALRAGKRFAARKKLHINADIQPQGKNDKITIEDKKQK